MVRQTRRSAAPEATERISYGIPTFHRGVNLVHFAGYRNHIGFYPGADGIEGLKEDLRSGRQVRGRDGPKAARSSFDLRAAVAEVAAEVRRRIAAPWGRGGPRRSVVRLTKSQAR